jgi:steroid Delta-isomerase
MNTMHPSEDKSHPSMTGQNTPHNPAATDLHLARLVHFYENLSPETLDNLHTVYTDAVKFKDPFNDVQGLNPLRRIFQDMFVHVQLPRFKVQEAIGHDNQGFLIWEFTFVKKGLPSPMCIRGSTHVRFNHEGRVDWHRDYWDAAEELYCKLPVVGGVFRWLQRKMA